MEIRPIHDLTMASKCSRVWRSIASLALNQLRKDGVSEAKGG